MKKLQDLKINTIKNQKAKRDILESFRHCTLGMYNYPNKRGINIDYENETIKLDFNIINSFNTDAKEPVEELLKELALPKMKLMIEANEINLYEKIKNNPDNEHEIVLCDFKISTAVDNIDVIYGDTMIWSNMKHGRILLTLL